MPETFHPHESSGDTPWPRYGELSSSESSAGDFHAQTSSSSFPENSGMHGGTGSTNGSASGSPYATGTNAAAQGYPGQAATVPGGYPGTGPAGAPMTPGKAPSRAPAITTLIVGILLSVVVAPIAFFGILFGALGNSGVMSSALPVTSGDTVTVDSTGTYMVVAPNGRDVACTLSNDTGEHPMDPMGDGVSYGMGLEAGDYTLTCTGATGLTMYGFTGADPSALTSAVLWSFGIGTLLGIGGVILAIIGIVLLVKANRRRREYFINLYVHGVQPPMR
ncbi:hypothetical protein G7Y41_08485 [Schaalia sp. ZJ405]|uniref:hypothetical protein n=1 Tax=Schaalia sp. ZJ405 TaxID=2709403 RepID=UPI0013ED6B7C|nr:hypothetical protein [Schaalia sp. ZJ405]QPK81064.1 hypothetical protein G7Y41_08485 [Schaalia sp. ZJ405]